MDMHRVTSPVFPSWSRTVPLQRPDTSRGTARHLAKMLSLTLPVMTEQRISQLARGHKLRRTDIKALICIAELAPLPTGRLVQILGISPGNATGLLDRLESKQLIRRDRDPQDRRQVSLYLAQDIPSTPAISMTKLEETLESVLAQHDPDAVKQFLDLFSECVTALQKTTDI